MARTLYACGPADVVAKVDSVEGDYERDTTVLNAYTTRTGSTQLTDLQTLAGLAITSLTPDAQGRIRFYGPDGYKAGIWVGVGTSGERSVVWPADGPDRLAALETAGTLSHRSLLELGADDHLQYHNDARGDVRYYTKAQTDAKVATGTGITDHGGLTGLADDDHPQYHTDVRGDARYYTKAQAAALGVSTPTADTMMRRDAAGRSQVTTPLVAADVATKEYADGLGSSTATPSSVARRDAAGRMQAVDPAVAADVATRGWTLAQVAAGMRRSRITPQSIPHATTTQVTFGTVDYDNGGWVVDASTFTVPPGQGGLIDITVNLTFAAAASGRFNVMVTLNSTAVPIATDAPVLAGDQRGFFSSGGIPMSVGTSRRLAAGDTLRVWVFQNSGAPLDLVNSFGQNEIVITRVSA